MVQKLFALKATRFLPDHWSRTSEDTFDRRGSKGNLDGKDHVAVR